MSQDDLSRALKVEAPPKPKPAPVAVKPAPAAVKPAPAAVAVKPKSSSTAVKVAPTSSSADHNNKRAKPTPAPIQQPLPPPVPPKPVQLPPASNPSKLLLATKLHPKYQSLYVDGLEKMDEVPSRGEWEGDQLHVLAMDCEMIQTVDNDMALARISVVEVKRDWRNSPKMVLDELVMPTTSIDFIVDARTAITGLDANKVAATGLSIAQARKRFLALLEPHTIVVGHALEHDLLAMEVRYTRVIDTALLFDVEGNEQLTHGLAFLYSGIVGPDTANGEDGRAKRGGSHDSVEDAVMTFKIIQTLLCTPKLYGQDFPIILPREQAGWRKQMASQRGPIAAVTYDRIVANNNLIKLRLDELKRE
ncbi:hypothetical protein BASA81_001146 [Batrachochytrium salamandrivorans]|nr:hypothetical protein BASA81_001146 [Batrachochytrium salamandrivorans]